MASSRAITLLEWVYAAAVAVVLLGVVAVAELSTDADIVPDWFAALAVAAITVPALFVIRYYRRRPAERGLRDYTVTALFRIGVAVLPAAVGFAGFLVTESRWVYLLGVLLSLPGLAWSIPSSTDYQRHVDLATAIDEHPPEEVWGSAPPDEPAPWDAEPGHGHGLHE